MTLLQSDWPVHVLINNVIHQGVHDSAESPSDMRYDDTCVSVKLYMLLTTREGGTTNFDGYDYGW